MTHRILMAGLLALAALTAVACGSNSDNNKTTIQTAPQVTQAAATQGAATQAAATTSAATQADAASTYQPQRVSSSVTRGVGTRHAHRLGGWGLSQPR